MFERRLPEGRLYVCAGPVGSIGILEEATDRAPAPASTPLSGEVLVELVALVAAISGSLDRRSQR